MLGSATKLKNVRNIKLQGAVSGEVNFDGSKDVVITTTQANIAIVEGTINIVMNEGQEQVSFGQKAISFPEGFNKDNSVVMLIGLKNIINGFWGYGSITEYAGSVNSALIEKGIVYRQNDMLLNLRYDGLNLGGTASSTRTDTFNYRIVLMKIS